MPSPLDATTTTPFSLSLAGELIHAILAGQPAPNPLPESLGDWQDTIHTLETARAAGGTDGATAAWQAICRARPELTRLDPWPERTPLRPLPAVPSLPDTLLPDPLRPWLVDVATRGCIPLAYVAAPAIVALGAVVGRAMGIRPGKFDDYIAVANLWGGIIGGPGTMKSFAVSEALRPLPRLASEATTRYEKQRRETDTRRERTEAEISAIKDLMKQAAKGRKAAGTPTLEELEGRLTAKKAQLDALTVTERRYLTQDATTEKLGELLRENPRGLLVARDELAGWLRTLERPGREGDRELYLEAWNGSGSYTYDRIGRGTIHIPALTVSIIGGIQPGKLSRYIADALADGDGADGLMQRVQVIVWPDGLEPWKPPDHWPDTTAKNQAYTIFAWLDALPAHLADHAAVWHVEEGDIPTIRFDPHAQALYDEWRAELEGRLRGETLAAVPGFAAHLAKYRSLMPCMALLFHLVEVAAGRTPGPVPLAPTRLAEAWCEYLELHARKVYAPELLPGVDGAHTLAKKIEAGAISDGETIRELYRAQWSGLRTPAAVQAAVDVLKGAGWVRARLVDTGGRSSEVLDLHPDFKEGGS